MAAVTKTNYGECKSAADNAVDEIVNARREFNVHFTTFWHLAHLATFDSRTGPITTSWSLIAYAGKKWKDGITSEFTSFDGKLTRILSWMEDKLFPRGFGQQK